MSGKGSFPPSPEAASGSQEPPSTLLLRPAQFVVLSFAVAILGGTVLLMLPVSTTSGHFTPPLTALFTATSAVCVTGLVVVDTGTYWSPWGRFILLGLIQLGGLGYMTIATGLLLFFGRSLRLRQRLVVREALGHFSLRDAVTLVKRIVLFTLVLESVGTLALYLAFLRYPEIDALTALYYGLFHSVSAFCNAGFDVLGAQFGHFSSLTRFCTDPLLVGLIAILILLGGIGFVVLDDLVTYRRWRQLSFHSRLTLTVTGFLLVIGTLVLGVVESHNPPTLGRLSGGTKWFNAFFHALTPRTAGFSTLKVGDLEAASLFVTIVLMAIGASPGGTGGGFKTTTLAVVLAAIWATIRGYEDATVFHRTISKGVVYRALTVMVLAWIMITLTACLLSLTEVHILQAAPQWHSPFLDLFFEATSAFGTVGLSTGLTPMLSPAGRILLILTMFIGRIGPITLATALVQREYRPLIHYPEERVFIG